MATLSAYDAGMPEFYITPPVKSREVGKPVTWLLVLDFTGYLVNQDSQSDLVKPGQWL